MRYMSGGIAQICDFEGTGEGGGCGWDAVAAWHKWTEGIESGGVCGAEFTSGEKSGVGWWRCEGDVYIERWVRGEELQTVSHFQA